MSKFHNVLTEAAYAIAGHGFAEQEIGDLSEPGMGPWQAMVRVSHTVLLNLGEDELASRFKGALVNWDNEWYVWIVEHEDGRVEQEMMCNADLMPDQIAVMDRDWMAVEDHYNTEPVTGPTIPCQRRG